MVNATTQTPYFQINKNKDHDIVQYIKHYVNACKATTENKAEITNTTNNLLNEIKKSQYKDTLADILLFTGIFFNKIGGNIPFDIKHPKGATNLFKP